MSEENEKNDQSAKGGKPAAKRKSGTPAAARKKSAAKPTESAAKEKSNVSPAQAKPKSPEKPLVTSNTDEKGISGLLWSLLLLAVLAGGGFATKPLWLPYVVDYLPGLEKTADLEPPEDKLIDRLTQIEQEISRVRESGEAVADLERERGRLNQSIEGVMVKITDLEKQIDYVRGMLQATSPPSDAVDTNESLQRLSSRMNKLEESDETVNAVMERLAKLEQAMAERNADETVSAEELSQTMTAISERIGTLESGLAQSAAGETETAVRSQQQVRAQTLVLAVGHLREALRSNASFAPALGALEALGEGDPDIMRGVQELAPYADTGIATMDQLRRDFILVAQSIGAAAPEAQMSENTTGYFDKAMEKVKTLVSIRKSGSHSSAPADGPAGKAMQQLTEGDLAGAITTLEALYGPEAEAATPWLEKARARLTAETALSRLHVFVVSLLAPAHE